MPRIFSHISILTALALALLSSCLKETADPMPEPTRVLLVYVGTDNNLSGYEQVKLQGLRDGWTGRTTDHIIAYIDDRSGDARLIEISNLPPGQQPRRIASYSTENSADAATLSRVIGDVHTSFPADSYGLLVFSHASGWLPQGVYNAFASGKIPDTVSRHCNEPETKQSGNDNNSTRSIIIDGTNEMELTDFAAAIPDGMFDYIVFEACFMAGIEVAWELRNKAPYIFASGAEIVDPGFAPTYSTATGKILGQDLAGFGRGVFTHTLTYAESNPQRSAAYSVIRTAGLDALAAFVHNNCDFTRKVDITAIQRFDRLAAATLFFDFGDYYGRLLDNNTQQAEFARLLDGCIPWKAATETFMTQSASYNGFSINRHSGLTTYIPQPSFPGLNAFYHKLGWAQTTHPK